jgi:hypothetical protein
MAHSAKGKAGASRDKKRVPLKPRASWQARGPGTMATECHGLEIQ